MDALRADVGATLDRIGPGRHLVFEAGLGADRDALTAYLEATGRPVPEVAGFVRGEAFNPWDRLDPEWRLLAGVRGEF